MITVLQAQCSALWRGLHSGGPENQVNDPTEDDVLGWGTRRATGAVQRPPESAEGAALPGLLFEVLRGHSVMKAGAP